MRRWNIFLVSMIFSFSLFFALAQAAINGAVCTTGPNCDTLNCATDYDTVGKWCAPATNCVHSTIATCDSSCYSYATGSTSNYYRCDSGVWTQFITPSPTPGPIPSPCPTPTPPLTGYECTSQTICLNPTTSHIYLTLGQEEQFYLWIRNTDKDVHTYNIVIDGFFTGVYLAPDKNSVTVPANGIELVLFRAVGVDMTNNQGTYTITVTNQDNPDDKMSAEIISAVGWSSVTEIGVLEIIAIVFLASLLLLMGKI